LKPEAQQSNYAIMAAYRDAKAELPPGFDDASDDEPSASSVDDIQFENV
jgi:hypothetical protein